MTVTRILYLLLGLAMATFAWLQINDPDPWLWVPIYLCSAALFLAALFGWFRRWAVVSVWVIYAILMLLALPGFVEWLLHHPWSDLTGEMSADRQYIEDSRELLGLLIAALCLLFLWLRPPSGRANPAAEN